MVKKVMLGVLVTTIVVTLVFFGDQATATLTDMLTWVQGLGVVGALVLAALYIPAAVLFIPGSLLTLGAGFAFGVGLGTVAVSVGSVAGATVAFILGRTLARDMIEKKVAANPSFGAVDRAVGKNGFKIVLLTRLSPVFPFNFLNYAYGVTHVSLKDYVLASWIGMLPGTLMYVYIGSALQNLAALTQPGREKGTGELLLFGVGLLVTVLVTVFVTRIARKALKEAQDDVDPPATLASPELSAAVE